MEQLTTYRAKGKTIGLEFLFKYNLNGYLRAFEIVEGELNDEQIKWLFSGNFPADENIIKERWMKLEKYLKVFEITTAPAVLTFEALWELYDHKVAKQDALKSFNKLKKGDVIKCFIEVPYYLQYLKKNPGIGKLHLATYINKRRFDDERPQSQGKNFNPIIKDFAELKTEK